MTETRTTFLVEIDVETLDPIAGERRLIDALHEVLVGDVRPAVLGFAVYRGSVRSGVITGDAAAWVRRPVERTEDG